MEVKRMAVTENALITTDTAGKQDVIPVCTVAKDTRLGYTNEVYEFLNEKGQHADGCLLTIEPAESPAAPSNAIGVFRSMTDTTFQEAIVDGEGYFLAQTPKGDVISIEFGKEDVGTVVEWSGIGWVDTWIAKKQGAKVADITEPKFAPETEQEITIDDPSVSPDFWKEYHRLKGDSNLS